MCVYRENHVAIAATDGTDDGRPRRRERIVHRGGEKRKSPQELLYVCVHVSTPPRTHPPTHKHPLTAAAPPPPATPPARRPAPPAPFGPPPPPPASAPPPRVAARLPFWGGGGEHTNNTRCMK